MTELEQVFIDRDDMTPTEARAELRRLRAEILAGADPEELLLDECGLEPDYIFDIL
jgi:hypothetical protein